MPRAVHGCCGAVTENGRMVWQREALMPTTTVEIRDAPTRLSELVELARLGADVLLTEGGTPQARLVAVPPPGGSYPRIPGLHAGEPGFWMSDDFDAPLPDEFWLGRS